MRLLYLSIVKTIHLDLLNENLQKWLEICIPGWCFKIPRDKISLGAWYF